MTTRTPQHPGRLPSGRVAVVAVALTLTVPLTLAVPGSAAGQQRWWERGAQAQQGGGARGAGEETAEEAMRRWRSGARQPAPSQSNDWRSRPAPSQRAPQTAPQPAAPQPAAPQPGGQPAAPQPGGQPAAPGGGAGALTGPGAANQVAPYALQRRPEYAWKWQQVLSSPRIGGRLTAVAVDPRNPNRIYVGTEEYTLLRSTDGGVTWREIELDPFVRSARDLRPETPGLPQLGEVLPNGFDIFVDPPYRENPANRISVPGNIGLDTFFEFGRDHVNFGPQNLRSNQHAAAATGGESSAYFRRNYGAIRLPNFGVGTEGSIGNIRPLVTVGSAGAPQALLDDAIRPQEAFAVRRIALCPAAVYPLMIATQNELLGSQDDGLTWVRLLRLPGTIQMNHIGCGEQDPNLLIAATSFGPYISNDGGITFDQDLSGWPGRDATAAAFDPRPGFVGMVHVATGSDLFSGDPRSREGLRWAYPDFNDSSTAPWERINWIEPTLQGEVWLATADGGRNWETVSRLLLARQKIEMLRVGSNELGGQRVAVVLRDCTGQYQGVPLCRRSMVYASDDNGQTWFPFFDGITRRTASQVAPAPAVPGFSPRWWVVTGGELWSTVDPASINHWGVDREAQAWAQRRLQTTPPLTDTVNALLTGTRMTEEHLNEMIRLGRLRHLSPEIHTRLEITEVTETLSAAREIAQPQRLNITASNTEVTAWAFVQWRINDVPFYGTGFGDVQFPGARGKLYELRRQLQFIAEDAWHERVLLLNRMSRGMEDPLQIEAMKVRIEGLETLLEIWMRQPLRQPLRLGDEE